MRARSSEAATSRTAAPGRRRDLVRKALAVAVLLAYANGALAGNILRRSGAGAASQPGASPGGPAPGSGTAAATAAAQAAALVRDLRDPLRRAMESIQQFGAAQDVARAAASGGAGTVPNGLVPGGLDVAPGATPGSSLWQGASAPTSSTGTDGRTGVTVVQNDSSAILTWTTFNVGRETDVYFDQRAGGKSASGWVALNRVEDPAAAPSQILGSIRAEGQVYVINRNGILFGGTSQVNVGTLVATGLDFAGASVADRNKRFLDSGLLSQGDFTFTGVDPTTANPAGAGSVVVAPGARIAVAPYGQALLLGGQVTNGGTIEAPDGQVILAAGHDVRLGARADQRGFVATVNGLKTGATFFGPDDVAENTGVISVPRGNISMQGSLVEQNGLLTATTSTDAAGSIVLGTDQKGDVSGPYVRQPVTISFGTGSVTQILPDANGKTLIGSTAFTPSSLRALGERISVLDGASVYVPSGNVELSATVASQQIGAPDTTRVYVGVGATIDVSGLRDVELAMERNTIRGELRANELRDNPLLRNGPLRGATVYFDARDGVNVADLSGYYALIERGIDELMTGGGTVRLAANEIVTREGSLIDISGGSVRYSDGYVRSTVLLDPSGRPVRIEDADPGVAYVGLAGGQLIDHVRWNVQDLYAGMMTGVRPRWEPGYVEGHAAGKLTIDTNPVDWYSDNINARPSPVDPSATGAFRILLGDLRADVVVGSHQRSVPTGSTDPTVAWQERPAGGTLEIGRSGGVEITAAPLQPLDTGFGADTAFASTDPRKYQLLLPAAWFNGKTIARVTITDGYTDDGIPTQGIVAARNMAPGTGLDIRSGVVVNLGDGGTFSYTGKGAEVAGSILAPGGAVTLRATQLAYNVDPNDPEHMPGGSAPLTPPTVHLGPGATIDVAGRLTNESIDGDGPRRPLTGGSVSLQGRVVQLDAGSVVDVSGGAVVDATGTKITPGDGGSIALSVGVGTAPVNLSALGVLDLSGELRGYAPGKGGSLSIATQNAVRIDTALPPVAGPEMLVITPEVFSSGGFASYSIVGAQGITVATTLTPHVETLLLPDSVTRAPTGASLLGLATPTVLPEGLHQPMSLTLSAGTQALLSTSDAWNPSVTILEGAGISMAPGSTIRLTAPRAVEVDGTLEVRGGGTIELSATGRPLTSTDPRSVVNLGPDAQVLARGTERETPSGGLVRHTVVAGGNVTLSAYDDVVVAPSAVVDVSGIRGVADLETADGVPYAPRPVDGAAGKITISAMGGSIAGHLLLAPGGESGAGGMLTITAIPGMRISRGAPSATDGRLAVDEGTLDRSGADDLVLATIADGASSFQQTSAIVFQGDVSLSTRRSITLLSPLVTAEAAPGAAPGTLGSVELQSAYVLLKGGTGVTATTIPAPRADQGLVSTLTVDASLIDVRNEVWLGCSTANCTAGGFDTVRLRSTGDIRLTDQGTFGSLSGLFTPGAIELQADQVYVTSRQQVRTSPTDSLVRGDADPGFLVQSGVSITVAGNGGDVPAVPLSFGERLTLRAPQIVQGGVVRAPMGQIRLEGSSSVTLLEGSVTSTSLEGALVPFGSVTALGNFGGYDQAGAAPEKAISVVAPSVDVRRGAVVDVSGGGDVLGYRFAPGNGGSSDVLANSGGFAIVPGLGASPAPVGGAPDLSDSRLSVGDAVYLEGVPGLAPGVYTLLPAHYALLPGGLLVNPIGGTSTSAPSTAPWFGATEKRPDTFARPDGALVAPGYFVVNGTDIRSPGWREFVVMPASVFLQYSELPLYSFTDSVARLASDAGMSVRTANDAGRVAFDAQDLQLQGTGRFGAGDGGLLGTLDVSATRIAVVGAGGAAPAGYLRLDPADLTAFGAGSILLGGRRTAGQGVTNVAVSATDVVVDTSGSAWTGPEILLAATGSIAIRAGSVLGATGAGAGDPSPLQLAGDGAFVRLSSGARVAIQRTGSTGAAGDLTIGGAQVTAAGSVSLDGSRNIALDPSAVVQAPQVGISSALLSLGDAPAGTAGTVLGPALLGRLAQSSDLYFQASREIDLFGGLTLGSRAAGGAAAISRLTLDSGLVVGRADVGGSDVHLTAGELVLQNGHDAAADPGLAGAGQLLVDADTLVLGPGNVRLAGFGVLAGSATLVEARGTGGLSVGGSVSLAVGELRAASGARSTIDASGDVALTSSAAAVPAATGALGGAIELLASNVTLDTRVVLPAGSFQATARTGDLALGGSALVDVRGAAVDLEDRTLFAPGGEIALSAAGALTMAPTAALDVSGSDRGGDAGSISLAAGGAARVEGALRGAAANGGRGGSFTLDAAGVGGAAAFATLNAGAERGGFTEARTYRLRQEDLVLAPGDRITAHEVVLRSDGGAVLLDGEIDAAGTATRPAGGIVVLRGANGVVVGATSRIDASAASATADDPAPASGSVEIVATGGSVDLQPGSVIDLSGGDRGGGSLVVRAPRQGSDVAIARLGADLRGARQVVVQGLASYEASSVDATLAAAMQADAAAWLAAAGPAVAARLGSASGAPTVATAMRVTSPGSLSVDADVSLATGAGLPGHLELEAQGALDVRAAVSDGFATADRGAALLGGRSSGISLVAGGDVTLHPNAIVRTGTGAISIEAGRDIVLLAATQSADHDPVVYTAGSRGALAPGFGGAPVGLPLGEFPVDGGDVHLSAGRDILAPFAVQTTSAWLFRYGSASWNQRASDSTIVDQTSWSVVYRNFESGVGALGGGDVRVDAGRDVVQLQVAIPTTGQLTTAPGQVAQPGDLVVRGGGDLDLTAGRDVLGGTWMLGRGHAEVRAGGGVLPSATEVALRRTADNGSALSSTRDVGVLVGLMDATARVTAASDVVVEGVYDPMLQGQVTENLGAAQRGAAFQGYSEQAGLEVTSLAGGVTYRQDPWASVDLTGSSRDAYKVTMTGSGDDKLNKLFGLAPPTLGLYALGSDVALTSIFTTIAATRTPPKGKLLMAPAADGTLEVLARDDVRIGLDVELSDVAPQFRRGPLDPMAVAANLAGDTADLGVVVTRAEQRGDTPIHAADLAPVRIVAQQGTVCADISGECVPGAPLAPVSRQGLFATVTVPKSIEVIAGEDVLLGDYRPQNNGPGAFSLIRAGRDVFDVGYEVSGEGAALLVAGRDVIQHPQATSKPEYGGVVLARGDNGTQPNGTPNPSGWNPALPHDRAANITILAGASGRIDWDAFAAVYLDPSNASGVPKTYLDELGQYLQSIGLAPGTVPQRLATFAALPWAQRAAFLDEVLFAELKQTGIDYNDASSPRFHSYDRGFQATRLLFPGAAAGEGGDVLLGGKPVETWAAGDITVLAPYGQVQVGAQSLPASFDPASGGIVTRRGGDIRVMADENIDLFTSRVFSLQGGDVTMWTSHGSITAGAGSKTAVFSAPLSYTMTSLGVVTVNAFGIQTGAGIGVLDAIQNASDRRRSRLDLIAPEGEVNAGDAGIRVVGDINIAAQVVVGVENIQVTGAQAGVPQVEAPSLGAVAAATQSTQAGAQSSVAEAAKAAATTAATLPSIITVEVVGYESTPQEEEERARKAREEKGR
jgi:filamentous hemagglutinin family protein